MTTETIFNDQSRSPLPHYISIHARWMFILSLYYFHSQNFQLLGKIWSEIFSNFEVKYFQNYNEITSTLMISYSGQNKIKSYFIRKVIVLQRHPEGLWANQMATEQTKCIPSFFSLHLNKPLLSFFKCGEVWVYHQHD